MSLLTLWPVAVCAGHLEHYQNLSDHTHDEDDNIAVPELDWAGVDKVNRTHSYLSSTVERLSQRIDSFFGEDRVYEEATGTYVQARTSVVLNERGDIDYDLKFRAKLRLPQLKSRFRLIIESDDKQGLDDDFDSNTTKRSLTEEVESTNLAASLQYILKQTKKINVSLRPGVKLSTPLEAFLRARLSRELDLTEKWLSRGTGELGYYTEDGWGSDWRLEFERRIGKRDFFRTTSSARWREDTPGNWFLRQALSITHILNTRSSIVFSAGINGETNPTLHNTAYYSNVRYRRDIHRGWMFMELRPQVVFAKENDYDEDVSLTLRFEILLGSKYAHE